MFGRIELAFSVRSNVKCRSSLYKINCRNHLDAGSILVTLVQHRSVSCAYHLAALLLFMIVWLNQELFAFTSLVCIPGLIIGLRPANERRCYFATTALIGLAQAWPRIGPAFSCWWLLTDKDSAEVCHAYRYLLALYLQLCLGNCVYLPPV